MIKIQAACLQSIYVFNHSTVTLTWSLEELVSIPKGEDIEALILKHSADP